MTRLLQREFIDTGVGPKEFVVRDIRRGTGPALKPGDRIHVDYFIIDYDALTHGGSGQLYRSAELAAEAVVKGWRRGLPGMRVGGRRVLMVPPRLGFAGVAHAYVVDLLTVPG